MRTTHSHKRWLSSEIEHAKYMHSKACTIKQMADYFGVRYRQMANRLWKSKINRRTFAWTSPDIQIVLLNYPVMSGSDVAKKIGKGVTGKKVCAYAYYKLGMKKK